MKTYQAIIRLFSRNLTGQKGMAFNAMKEKGLKPRILYLARLSFKFEGVIKQYPGKQKLREFTSHKPSLQCILKGLL